MPHEDSTVSSVYQWMSFENIKCNDLEESLRWEKMMRVNYLISYPVPLKTLRDHWSEVRIRVINYRSVRFYRIIHFPSCKVDPGEVKGTKLRILKYPHPKVTTLICIKGFTCKKKFDDITAIRYLWTVCWWYWIQFKPSTQYISLLFPFLPPPWHSLFFHALVESA